MKICLTNHGIQLPDCSRLAINWKNDNDVTICQHEVIVKFFWCCFVSLVRFSCWSKFHVNIITGSRVMTVFFIGDWPENQKWEIPPIWVLGQVRDTKFGINVSNEMLLNAAKYQGYSFYCFLSYYGKTNRGRVKLPHPTQIRVTSFSRTRHFISVEYKHWACELP